MFYKTQKRDFNLKSRFCVNPVCVTKKNPAFASRIFSVSVSLSGFEPETHTLKVYCSTN
jgi:hypothetical protein